MTSTDVSVPAHPRPATSSEARAARPPIARQRTRRHLNPRSWTTPNRIVALASASAIACVLLAVAAAAGIGAASNGLRVIGEQTGPVVISSSNLYFALSDMDAQVANVLLVADRQDLGLGRTQALAIYDQRRAEASHYLVQTVSLSGDDPALPSMLADLGRYEELVGQAMLLESGPDAQPGQPPAAALDQYRLATDLMHGRILPAARSLSDGNAASLGRAYADAHSSTSAARYRVAGAGLLALTILVLAQLYLARRLRRWINPGMAAATLVVLTFIVAALVVLTDETEHLRGAKQDAFDSILALSQARAVSYDANADESRYLLDPQRRDQYEQAFLDKTQQLVGLPGASIPTWDKAYAAALVAYRGNLSDVAFAGYLGTEMRNITFVGERDAAERTLAAYQTYQTDDRHIRELVHSGDLAGAIRFCTSFATGDSNYAFDQYDKALSAVIDINVGAFGQDVADGQRELSFWTSLPWVSVVLVVGLIVAGLRPRLAEYF
jgi:hypothetical protein